MMFPFRIQKINVSLVSRIAADSFYEQLTCFYLVDTVTITDCVSFFARATRKLR